VERGGEGGMSFTWRPGELQRWRFAHETFHACCSVMCYSNDRHCNEMISYFTAMIDFDLHLWHMEQRRIRRSLQRALNRRRPVDIQLPPPPPLVRQYAGNGTATNPIDISSDDDDSNQAQPQ